MLGLGWGPKQLPYRGPGPPSSNWDGLSVVVSPVPRKATAAQLWAPLLDSDSFFPVAWFLKAPSLRYRGKRALNLRRTGCQPEGQHHI